MTDTFHFTPILNVSPDRLARDDDRQPCCGRRPEHCDCGAPEAETLSAGTIRAALRDKQQACADLAQMGYAIMRRVGLRGQISWIKITDWLCLRADLTEPRTADELAAQWREAQR